MEQNDLSDPSDPPNTDADEIQRPIEFKKPVLIGKIGKLPRKAVKPLNSDADDLDDSNKSKVTEPEPPESVNLSTASSSILKAALKKLSPAELLREQAPPLPYKEPKWSGLPPPNSGYKFEVLKSGVIIETIDVTEKPFFVFGRLAGCDIVMAHPTISRYHAVLQYKARETEDDKPPGFYLYDLGSSHGTTVNKVPLKSHQYIRVRVGHVIKLGCSTRLFILQGPDDDKEEESELTLTEMKQLRMEKKKKLELELIHAKLQREKEEEEREKKFEQDGISWGMGDDADEETDLTENPYAQPSNEELYLDDPKKTLRGYFEREGLTLEYDCQERGIGQYVCRVELPIEDARGIPIVAEVMHKGKKKDAVIQCALEACRIIDRQGLLRQAKHESRKRKIKDWKEDDFYDSDEDTFLDRTGSIEKKRERRMKEYDQPADQYESKYSGANKSYTYNELLDICKDLQIKLDASDKKLSQLREKGKPQTSSKNDSSSDALDEFMNNLGKHDQSVSDKAEISKTKMEIQKLKLELAKMVKLAEIAKPANLPELIKSPESNTTDSTKGNIIKKTGNSIFIGKKIVKQSKKFVKHTGSSSIVNESNPVFEEEVESDEENDHSTKEDMPKPKVHAEQSPSKEEPNEKKNMVTKATKKTYGPMRPPTDYVIPDDYYSKGSDRDLPDITETDDYQ